MPSESDRAAANAAHRAWLHDTFAKAAAAADAIPVGDPLFGWSDRSMGSRVRTAAGDRWLRMVVEQQAWADGDFWTGNGAANVITRVAKPSVIAHWEWQDGTWMVRAELMTLAEGTPRSNTPELRRPIELAASWWVELRTSLRALAEVPTQRTHLQQADVTRRLAVFFGDRPGEMTVSRWTAAHTDLHWANLLAPQCVLVDWEGWGLAPVGYDAACLYVHSLLQPDVADRVRAELGEQLDTRDGLISQLYVTTRLLLRVEQGDYPGMAIPLHRSAEWVIERLSASSRR
ncbi:MAG: aminoglycoside phosphotransferase [Pseudonocardiaceae bacterium]